jgi:hypothetical protein
MNDEVKALRAKAAKLSDLRPDGPLTQPRSWGVYEIEPPRHSPTRRFRLGNHPVRMKELEGEFGAVRLVEVFTARELAQKLAGLLNRN